MGRYNPDDETTTKSRLGWGRQQNDEQIAGQIDLTTLARATDPGTSHAAASMLNAEGQRAVLLAAFADYPDGLTAREASRIAGITEGWKRVSDLLRVGRLRDTGMTRVDPDTGRRGRILVIA